LEPENWNRVEPLLQAVLDLEERRRTVFLQQSCAGDEDLRREIESLLILQNHAEKFMETPALEMAAEVLAGDQQVEETSRPDPPILNLLATEGTGGTVIGRYQLLQKIGEGGMGEVWLAEQKEPVLRRVALKLVKAGMDTREVIARFESSISA